MSHTGVMTNGHTTHEAAPRHTASPGQDHGPLLRSAALAQPGIGLDSVVGVHTARPEVSTEAVLQVCHRRHVRPGIAPRDAGHGVRLGSLPRPASVVTAHCRTPSVGSGSDGELRAPLPTLTGRHRGIPRWREERDVDTRSFVGHLADDPRAATGDPITIPSAPGPRQTPMAGYSARLFTRAASPRPWRAAPLPPGGGSEGLTP